eukprot:1933824-Pleurochrysis_carterae.AAC.3
MLPVCWLFWLFLAVFSACAQPRPETFVAPVHVPKNLNGVGSYRRRFRLPAAWLDRQRRASFHAIKRTRQ